MDLIAMRTSFHDHTSSLTSDLTDPQVDDYLNRAYQYTIPLDVGGEFSEQIWEIECVVAQDIYPYPDPMVAPMGLEPWIDEEAKEGNFNDLTSIGIVYLTYETDPMIFKRKYLSRKANGRPTAALFFGKEVKFSAPPDRNFVVAVPVRSGPLEPLSTTGIGHGTHAQAVVSAAAVDYLTEIEDLDDPGVMRETGRYKRFKDQLLTYALARPTERRYTRSF